ncbi:7SK snRNA methylphosphate capping enzyme-like [Carcharodon carcharias]|uniref:7SK snRNA methylphosphate capping enzyme-like n=1 Tax=Carcharodon carcharias TaxID=13397 RepID=UPI001B7EDB9E|nr:7SK snRNA methylphosphate capping enzyme-like [Carcharodon carcharias]
MKKLMATSVKEDPIREVTLLKPEYLSAIEVKVEELHRQGRALTPVSEEAALSPGAKDELGEDENVAELSRPKNGLQPFQQQRAFKRRNSLNVGFKHPGFKRRRRANSDCDPVLPSNFLLGGNIFDPLNLNSLLDEDVNKALNAETPKSSPLPCRNRDPVEILIPKDITDPLNLNNDSEVLPSPLKLGRKRRHRHYHHPPSQLPQSAAAELAEKSQAAVPDPGAQDGAASQIPAAARAGAGAAEPPPEPEGPQPYELNTVINCRDEIVSPVLRGSEHASAGTRHRKRRRTSSKSEPGKATTGAEEEPGPPGADAKKQTPEKPRGKASHHHHHHHHHQHQQQQHHYQRHSSLHRESKAQPNFQSKHKRFQYGNYTKYYGYRNPGRCEDPRLGVFKPDWFRGKDILDLGCNSGHLTLSIAKDLKPSRIVGVDIDGGLVHSARQNIRHFLSQDVLPSQGNGQVKRRFPLSLSKCKGPIAAPPIAVDCRVPEFPNNVTFIQGNYVLEKDELLETQRPEYDVILCLSLTKWIHLNWGDEGLKRMFKRIYRHLRAGGIFILEPQPWSSYGKRRKLTETIYKNYYKIIFKPEQFTSYLLSPEVGFSSYELVGTPQSTSKGFQRPVYLFHKGRPSSVN